MLKFKEFISERYDEEDEEENLHQKLSKHYNFNEKEKEQIKDYTSIWKTRHDFSGLTSRHKTPTDLTVYRGQKTNSVDNFHEKDVKSTSLSDYIARGYGKHVLAIHVPKGSAGAYIAHHSKFESEREFLLHPKAKIKLTGKKETQKHGDEEITVHHANLIHDGVKSHE